MEKARIMLEDMKAKVFNLNMLMELLEIKFDRIQVSNERLDEMIDYFSMFEKYEYCDILKKKKAPVLA